MQIVGGLITLANLLLSLVVSARLYRLGVLRGGIPELGLASYFLFTSFLANGLSCALYLGWADPTLTLGDVVARPLNAIYHITAMLGFTGLYVFCWQTFRPSERWARNLVVAACFVIFAGSVGVGLQQGFALSVVQSPSYWVAFGARVGALVWIALESFRYWCMQRKRLRLGLADPLVANRFLLWGIWAVTVLGLASADWIARIFYVAISGITTHVVPDVAMRIIEVMVVATSVLGIAAAIAVWLTFFPSRAYATWLTGSSNRTPDGAG